MTVAFYLHFVYSIPSLVLYCLILYVIIRDRKELRGFYYDILQYSFVLDVLSYISNLVGIWILSFPMLNDFLLSLNSHPLMLTSVVFVHKLLLHAQNMRCIIGCIHRYTLIACPLTTNFFWDKGLIPLLIFIPIYGVIASSYIWFAEPFLFEAYGQIYWEFAHPAAIVWAPVAIITFYILGIALPNAMTMRALTQHKRDRIAERICHVTIACSLFQACNLIAMGLIGLSQMYRWNISQIIEINMLPFTRDTYTFSYPWFNFFINLDVRRRVLAILHLGSKQIGSASGTNSVDGAKTTTRVHETALTAVEPSNSKITITLDDNIEV